MLQSQLPIRTRKETPADGDSKNARLLQKAGFIYKQMAGVYTMLPLGRIVTEKIKNIIREEMNAIGAHELFMTALQERKLWETTNRWDLDVWFKLDSKTDDIGLGWTHEEVLAEIMSHQIFSYKDLPAYLYQIQSKFRNEKRAKSGILRGREFTMKDLYSFSKSQEEHDNFYEKVADAYEKIFKRVGLKVYKTFASGGDFSKFSHEYQVISPIGEDIIYLDKEKNIAINKEVFNDEVCKELGVDKNKLEEVTAIEVGNIFSLGTRFSEPFGVTYKDESGKDKPVIMGSYGIGVERLMGTIVEVAGNEDEIIFNEEVAPFTHHILALGDEKITQQAKTIYERLKEKGMEVLLDDRDSTPGEKLADSDILGIPKRIIVSTRNDKEGEAEVENRIEREKKMVKYENI